MPDLGGVTSNDIEGVIVKAAGKVAVSEILRLRDDELVGTEAFSWLLLKEVLITFMVLIM